MTQSWQQIGRDLADAVAKLREWTCDMPGKSGTTVGSVTLLADGEARVEISDGVTVLIPAFVSSNPYAMTIRTEGATAVKAKTLEAYGMGPRAACLARRAIEVLDDERKNLIDAFVRALAGTIETMEDLAA